MKWHNKKKQKTNKQESPEYNFFRCQPTHFRTPVQFEIVIAVEFIANMRSYFHISEFFLES